jgi:5-bromo-4-chloroindolyl phosphate hydrolysis protein
MDRSTQLISLRDFGGLSYPSKGLLEVCKVTEQTLRTYNTVQLVQSKVMHHIVSSEVNTFFPDEHFHEPFYYSHLCSLIKLISHCYFTLRKHHQVKLLNMKKQSSSVRKTFTKAVHFRGE